MTKLFNVSSGPHVRSKLTTQKIMLQVIIALMPVTILGIFNYGVGALSVILASVLSSVLTEAVFNIVTKRPQTISDGSAVLSGLLLALVLPPELPLYIPILGGIFAILVVKCLFGGLGHNFMNPALAGRCFLLISFGAAVANYKMDGVTTATPLANLEAGLPIDFLSLFLGNASGVIGSSVLGLLIGAVILLIFKGITCEIPAAIIVSFTAFMAIFGGRGFDARYLLVHLCGGGLLLGAFFMATDPVTSPVTFTGRLIFGALIGILSGLFRVFGSAADSVSYAIIIANMCVPFIEEFTIPTAYGHRKQKEKAEKPGLPKPAVTLFVITLIAGACLSGVFAMTKDAISEQKQAAQAKSYREVCPQAVEFVSDETLDHAVAALEDEIYGDGAFGKAYVNQVIVGLDASGNTAGYVISATSMDGYDGEITMSVGFDTEGTVLGIAFTKINETAGMGMLCAEPEFKEQFAGVRTDRFVLNKSASSAADNEIDSVSGASTSSGAVVNAVNAAIDFFAVNIR